MQSLLRTIIFATILRCASIVLGISLWQYGVVRPIYYLLIWIAMLSYILYYYIKPYHKEHLKFGIMGGILITVINLFMQYFIVWQDHVSKPFVNYWYEIKGFIEQQGYVFFILPFLTMFVGFIVHKYYIFKNQ